MKHASKKLIEKQTKQTVDKNKKKIIEKEKMSQYQKVCERIL